MVDKLVDIKDNKPNDELVAALEAMLDLAKKGEVRSYLSVFSWNDGGVSHGWVLDGRSPRRTMLGSMCELQGEFMTKLQIDSEDSVLSQVLF